MIPHSRPNLDEVKLETWGEMLKSGHLARGRFCERLEALFIERILGAPTSVCHARAVQSGTQALHLGLMALRLLQQKRQGPIENPEVVTSTLACGALVQAIRAIGAKPVLCDSTLDGNLDPTQALERIGENTLAVLVPHLYGKPVDLGPLLDKGVPILEDCAQTLAVDTPNGRVGTLGDLMMTSFYATKPICTGQGGLIASVNSELMDEIERLCRYDGRSDPGPGWNANLSDWSAALAIPQIERFDESQERRARIAEYYSKELRLPPDSVVLPEPAQWGSHGWYRYVILVPKESQPWERKMNDLGVDAKRPVYLPQHQIFHLPGEYPLAEEHWRRSLSIPIYPALSDAEVERVVEVVGETAKSIL